MEKGYERRGERRSFEARRRLPRRPTRGVEGEDRRAATRGRHERREQINTGENDSTKLSSILTVQNSKFHIETRKISRMKVVQNLISPTFVSGKTSFED